MKKVWFCKHCGHWEVVGEKRADVIVGLCPKCFYFMSQQEWHEKDIMKKMKHRKTRITAIADRWENNNAPSNDE